MTALAADTNRVRGGEQFADSPIAVPMKAGQVYYQGSAIVWGTDGYGYTATAAASRKSAGVARTGGTAASPDGTTIVEVDAGSFFFANKSGDAVVAGGTAYWEDDNTVRATGTGSSAAGSVERIDSTFGVLVRVNSGG